MMRKRLKHSVTLIIPTLNRSQFLKRALISVFNQTFVPEEIIVVDNGSNDKTYQMIGDSFKNIRYIYFEDKGVSKARNEGLKNANNELICFLDSDDEWKPKKIEKQLFLFDKNTNCKFLHTNEVWYRNGYHLNQLNKHKKQGGYIFENCLRMCCISPSSTMIHRSIFDNHGIFDENLYVCEDYDMWLRISSKEKIYFLNEPLVIKHGGHSDQLSKQHWGMDRFRVYSIEKNIKQNKFSKEQKFIAIRYLLEKIQILINGAKRRNNREVFNKYSKKFDFWSDLKRDNL